MPAYRKATKMKQAVTWTRKHPERPYTFLKVLHEEGKGTRRIHVTVHTDDRQVYVDVTRWDYTTGEKVVISLGHFEQPLATLGETKHQRSTRVATWWDTIDADIRRIIF